MRYLEVEYTERIAVVKLNRKSKNAFNTKFAREVFDTLLEIRDSEKVRGLVVTSTSDKFFSIGFDVSQLYSADRREFERFFRSFSDMCYTLYTFPKPTVAAITGHAVAGGCILALCCDYRFMAERGYIGLNEVRLGVPIPLLAYLVLNQIVGDRYASEIAYSGELYTPQQALEMKLIDGIFSINELLAKSVEKAEKLAELPGKAFQAIKQNRTRMVEKEYSEHFEEDMLSFIEFWFSEEAREMLKKVIKYF
jgi:enoyl-CoA hydratase/carnithine racemase